LAESWPELPYEAWRNTKDTLHMELQIVGKLRLALSPFEPQWANVTLYLTARGLTTSPMTSSGRTFEVQVDLLDHEVLLLTTDGARERVPLRARPVAAFYQEFMAALDRLGIAVTINPRPSEVADPIPFDKDYTHTEYDTTWATRFFHVLSNVDLVLKEHRAHFRGRTSPVQFFWGTFDLAHLRYSGRPAQPPQNAGTIFRLSGDAEVICVGFWPGDARFAAPGFFSYAYPKPAGIEQETIGPRPARWDTGAGEFLLPYEDVRRASSPSEEIVEFAESVYSVASRLAAWDPGLVIARQPAPSLSVPDR
jgi:uncharacterized protein DUF5996